MSEDKRPNSGEQNKRNSARSDGSGEDQE
jgi:serine/threonine protein kinase